MNGEKSTDSAGARNRLLKTSKLKSSAQLAMALESANKTISIPVTVYKTEVALETDEHVVPLVAKMCIIAISVVKGMSKSSQASENV